LNSNLFAKPNQNGNQKKNILEDMKKLTKVDNSNLNNPKEDVSNVFGKRTLPVDINAKKIKNAKV
jgi:hypothetical protein